MCGENRGSGGRPPGDGRKNFAGAPLAAHLAGLEPTLCRDGHLVAGRRARLVTADVRCRKRLFARLELSPGDGDDHECDVQRHSDGALAT